MSICIKVEIKVGNGTTSIRTPRNEDVSFNQDTMHSPSYIEKYIKQPLNTFFSQYTLSCPKGVQNGGAPLYSVVAIALFLDIISDNMGKCPAVI